MINIKTIKGYVIFTAGVIILATIGFCFLILLPFKWIIPKSKEASYRRVAEFFGNSWAMAHVKMFDALLDVKWEIEYPAGISPEGKYLILCNHQSWVDIFVLFKVFCLKINFMRFFIKDQLKWLPFLGTSCIVLDYPFMKRYKREKLEKNPHLKGKDLIAAKLACQKLKGTSVAILNFSEGTRFTKTKHLLQNSPYRHLLSPKAGGIAYTLAGFEGEIEQILDVTIIYPSTPPSLMAFLCGKSPLIKVLIRQLPIPMDAHKRDYASDAGFRASFQEWLANVWAEKDALIDSHKAVL